MSEGSLPPFGPFRATSFPAWLARRVFGRRRPKTSSSTAEQPSGDRAAAEILAYAEAHAALFDRASRFSERAERLEREGTPSESARNRAERAAEEIRAGLAALRAKFPGEERGAFDREVERRYPAFKPRAGHP